MAENNSLPPLMTDKELLMEGSAYSEIMAAAFEYADAYCSSGDEPRRYAEAIDHLRKTVRAEIARFSRGNYAALPATEDSSAGDLAEVPDGFGSAEHWKEKAQYWAGVAHELRGQALRGEPVDGITQPTSQAVVQAEPAAGWLPYSRRISLAVRHGQKLTSEFNALVSDVIASYLETHGHFSRRVQAHPDDALDASRSGKWLTVVYRDVQPGDEAREIGSHQKVSALSWSHAIHDRDAAMAAAQEGGNAAKEA